MNVYSNPEAFGLTVVGEADVDISYEFDTFVVWRRADGAYVWADDSGCSCPMPFEDVKAPELPIGSARDALTDLRAWVGDQDREWRMEDRRGAARELIEILEAAA